MKRPVELMNLFWTTAGIFPGAGEISRFDFRDRVEAAARAGLREGDVILAIANTEVSGMKEFEAALTKADKSKAINVLYRRGDWAQYALIRPGR